MKRCVFFPLKTPYSEQYCINYRKAISPYFNIIDDKNVYNGNIRFKLLKYSFIADTYILNWLESVASGYKGLFLFLYSIISLFIIHLRGKDIVWMFHNIHPHEGENMYSRAIQKFLFKNAKMILSHSKEAAAYAEKYACCPVYYYGHPVEKRSFNISKKKYCDVFIWGTILPYKGIPEFLELTKEQEIIIRIIGLCKDTELEKRILALCNDRIVYENRRPDFDEIASWCLTSKFVVFPYIGDSISSSGALIDTITMGGTPIGPNKGSFHDLSEEEVCVIYNNEEELLNILQKSFKISKNSLQKFEEKYSWSTFGGFMAKCLEGIE